MDYDEALRIVRTVYPSATLSPGLRGESRIIVDEQRVRFVRDCAAYSGVVDAVSALRKQIASHVFVRVARKPNGDPV